MNTVLTASQWAERPELRAELQSVLNLPVMQAALATLEKGGLADMTIPKGFTDPIQGLAFSQAQKAGGLNFLNNLKMLPNLSNIRLQALRAVSDPAIEPTT